MYNKNIEKLLTIDSIPKTISIHSFKYIEKHFYSFYKKAIHFNKKPMFIFGHIQLKAESINIKICQEMRKMLIHGYELISHTNFLVSATG